MSRKFNTPRNLFITLTIIFLDIYLIYGFAEGLIFTPTDSTMLFVVSSIVFNLFLIVPILIKRDGASFYSVLYVIIYITGLVALAGNIITALLLIPSIISGVLALGTLNTTSKITKGVSLGVVLAFMTIIGKVMLLTTQQVPAPLTIELLSDRMMTIGLPVPITEYFGLFISTRYIDFITGPFEFLLYFFISSLLVENYHRIIKLLAKRKGGLVTSGYGAISALGCQCESAIGIFPAATMLIFNILLIPFFVLSAILLVLTYIMVVRYYEIKRLPRMPGFLSMGRLGKLIWIEILIVASQVLVVVGVLFSLQSSPVFLFGTSMVMILDGFLTYYLIHSLFPKRTVRKYIAVLLLLTSVLLVVIWFIPGLTIIAVNSPLWFSTMSYSAFTAGLMISVVYFSSPAVIGASMLEAFAVSVGILPIIFYYLIFSAQRPIWSFWAISQQAELSVVLWIIMLPFMWLSTQKSLISAMDLRFMVNIH